MNQKNLVLVTLSLMCTNAIVAMYMIISIIIINISIKNKNKKVSITSLLFIILGFGLQSIYIRYEISVVFQIQAIQLNWLNYILIPLNFIGRFFQTSELTLYPLKLVRQIEEKIIIVPLHCILKKKGMKIFLPSYYGLFGSIISIIIAIEYILLFRDNLWLDTFEITLIVIHDVVHVVYEIYGLIQLSKAFKSLKIGSSKVLIMKIQMIQVIIICCSICHLLVVDVYNISYILVRHFENNQAINDFAASVKTYSKFFMTFCTLTVLSVSRPLLKCLEKLVQRVSILDKFHR